MGERIAVVAAMEAELRFLRKAMSPPSTSPERLAIGSIGSRTIALLRTGVGPVKTRLRLAELGEPYPRCVLSIGCAGGLSPDVRPGDIIISALIKDDLNGASSYLPAQALVDLASDCCKNLGLSFQVGTMVSTGAVVSSVEAKRALGLKHGAVSVDMETAQVAAWAQGLGIPMLSIRTISDGIVDRIPPEIGNLVNPDGRVRVERVVGLFLRQPGLVLEMLRLKRQFDRSIDVLARIVVTLIGSV